MKRLILSLACSGIMLGSPLAWAEPVAKNVIFFLGDGMGPATVTAARIYRYGESGQLNMERLERTARIRTYSNDAQTTDSAPSMAAYMTGVKMNNEVLSMTSDTKAIAPGANLLNQCPATGNGQAVPTLLELAKAQGKAVGAVTTTRITHATPAATYAHICHRDAENDIAAQAVPGGVGYNPALLSGMDLLLGGGRRHFLPSTVSGGKRSDGRDLLAEMSARGYQVVQTASELAAVTPSANRKVLGLFHLDHMDYELDRVKKSLNQPSLAEMTAKAIDVLAQNPKGYVLMVEGGRIDHALHGTNAKRVMEDTIAFDEAIKTALGKVDLSNTLIVVTADHDHTLTINGYSKRGNPILDVARGLDGKPLKDADGKSYTTLVFGNGPNRPAQRAELISGSAEASQVLHDDYQQETGVRLSSETHGGGDVMLMSTGAGSSRFKGSVVNTKVFEWLKTALGL